MSGRRARAGARAAEAALWAAVVLAGAYVLLPAAVELVQAREQEAAETAAADGMEDHLRESQRVLDWFSSDPLAGPRVQQARARDARQAARQPAAAPTPAPPAEAAKKDEQVTVDARRVEEEEED